MAELLQVGLSSWIIADGNYRDFSVGDVRSFALEYYNEDEFQSSTCPISKRHLGESSYAVVGDRMHLGGLSRHLTPTWCVIDVGILAYRELHSWTAPPDHFSGEVYLGVDPFDYFERLAHESDAPALIYDWRIHRIEVETAPRIRKGGLMIYDPEKLGSADVQDTARGEDFVLHCELLSRARHKQIVHA